MYFQSVVLVLCLLLSCAHQRPVSTVSDPVALASFYQEPFYFRDEQERVVPLQHWQQDLMFITMGYTRCTRTCPMGLHTLQDIEKKLTRDNKKAVFVVISLRPEEDTPEQIQEYRRHYQLGEQWFFLRPLRPGDMERMGHFLGVNPYDVDGHTMHTFKIWAVAPGGRVLKVLDWEHREF